MKEINDLFIYGFMEKEAGIGSFVSSAFRGAKNIAGGLAFSGVGAGGKNLGKSPGLSWKDIGQTLKGTFNPLKNYKSSMRQLYDESKAAMSVADRQRFLSQYKTGLKEMYQRQADINNALKAGAGLGAAGLAYGGYKALQPEEPWYRKYFR